MMVKRFSVEFYIESLLIIKYGPKEGLAHMIINNQIQTDLLKFTLLTSSLITSLLLFSCHIRDYIKQLS